MRSFSFWENYPFKANRLHLWLQICDFLTFL